jgi:Steigviridae/Suoliviridae L,D-carboxypeptidase/transpeptidase
MQILVEREPSVNSCTIGKLSINGAFRCFTLEDEVREIPGTPVVAWKIPNQTAIPIGTYELTIDFSQRFGRRMIHILDVPGFDGIRIHTGNTAVDTDGCILVGLDRSGDRIARSIPALEILQPLVEAALDNNEPVTITVAALVTAPRPVISS